MMNNLKITIILFFVVLQSCATWKLSLRSDGDYNVAIQNAIIDMIHNNDRIIREDSVFSVNISDLSGDMIGISFYGMENKFLVIEGKKMDSTVFPTKYYEYSNKLFYWKDPSVKLNSDVLAKLDQYNMIDSLKSIAFAELKIDDAKEGIDYYFCKDNLLKYKKVKTNRIMGTYDPPKLDCKNK